MASASRIKPTYTHRDNRRFLWSLCEALSRPLGSHLFEIDLRMAPTKVDYSREMGFPYPAAAGLFKQHVERAGGGGGGCALNFHHRKLKKGRTIKKPRVQVRVGISVSVFVGLCARVFLRFVGDSGWFKAKLGLQYTRECSNVCYVHAVRLSNAYTLC